MRTLHIKAWHILVLLILACSLLWSVDAVAAAPADGESARERAYDATLIMLEYASSVYERLGPDNGARRFSKMLMVFFILLMIIKMLTQFVTMSSGPQWTDIIENAFVIIMVLIISATYDIWTQGIFNIADQLGVAIQEATICDGGALAPFNRINDAISTFVIKSGWSMLLNPLNWWKLAVMEIMGLIFKAAAFIAFLVTIWGLWGYAVAKMIGWFFIPFLLFQKLTWLFDGWFKLFFKYLVYVLVVRVTLSLAVIGFLFFVDELGTSLGGAGTGTGCVGDAGAVNSNDFKAGSNEIDFDSDETQSNILAIAMMPLMGGMVMLSTSSFSGQIAGGVQGLGAALKQLRGGARQVGGMLDKGTGGIVSSKFEAGKEHMSRIAAEKGGLAKDAASAAAARGMSKFGGAIAGSAVGTMTGQAMGSLGKGMSNLAKSTKAGQAVVTGAQSGARAALAVGAAGAAGYGSGKDWLTKAHDAALLSKAGQQAAALVSKDGNMSKGDQKALAKNWQKLSANERNVVAARANVPKAEMAALRRSMNGSAGWQNKTPKEKDAAIKSAWVSSQLKQRTGDVSKAADKRQAGVAKVHAAVAKAAFGANADKATPAQVAAWANKIPAQTRMAYRKAVTGDPSMSKEDKAKAIENFDKAVGDQKFASDLAVARGGDAYDSSMPPNQTDEFVASEVPDTLRNLYENAETDEHRAEAMQGIVDGLGQQGTIDDGIAAPGKETSVSMDSHPSRSMQDIGAEAEAGSAKFQQWKQDVSDSAREPARDAVEKATGKRPTGASDEEIARKGSDSDDPKGPAPKGGAKRGRGPQK